MTGGSGKAGRVVVRDLAERGYEVLNIDRAPSPESNAPDSAIPYLAADVTDFGQALEALAGGDAMPGFDAVVHLAAIPSPAHATPDQVFRTNMTSTHAVFAAAARLGLQRVVWASSETTLGLPFERPPDYAPVDEAHMYPETSYALSKVLGEEVARQFSRWSGIPFIGLRFSNIMVRDDYERFPSYWDDPHLRKWNLWGYVDESHVAQSVRLALEADVDGADSFIIAAADTVMKRPSRELMAEVFPGVPVADDVDGTDTLLAIRQSPGEARVLAAVQLARAVLSAISQKGPSGQRCLQRDTWDRHQRGCNVRRSVVARAGYHCVGARARRVGGRGRRGAGPADRQVCGRRKLLFIAAMRRRRAGGEGAPGLPVGSRR